QVGRHCLAGAAPDRAASLKTLRALWRKAWGDPIIVGFADSDDDAGWLRHADVAVVVQHPRRGAPARPLAKVPPAHAARRPGRQGWSEAILEVVGGMLSTTRGGYDSRVDIFSGPAQRRRLSTP